MEVSSVEAVNKDAGIEAMQPQRTLGERASANIAGLSVAPSSERYCGVDKPVYDMVKRLFDIVFSIVGLVVASPIMIATAIAIKCEDGGSILFHEKSIGKHGRPIIKLKFRSMKQNSHEILANFSSKQKGLFEIGVKVKDDPRITRVGHFIRKASIDELPQFITILKGDMTLVGPRVINSREIEFYGNQKEKFLSVVPGLTGWWQVNGRSNVTYEHGERQALELYYIDHRSFKLDMRILLKTVVVVLKAEGAR